MRKFFYLALSLFLVLTSLETALSKETVKQVVDPSDASDFVAISDVIPDVIQEIRYYTTYNFVGQRIKGYEEPNAFLTKKAAKALKAVADDVRHQGYRLKVYDAYRPQMAVDHFVAWSKNSDTKMKPYFYPLKEKNVLFKEGYIALKSGHTRGSTVDLTLFDMKTGKDLDMGGTFDYFGELSHYAYKGNLTKEQLKNREILHNAMLKHGFNGLAEEWWHFTLKDEPYPNTFFTFPVNRNYLKSEYQPHPSPAWVAKLPQAQNATQMFIVAGVGQTTATVSMHKKVGQDWIEIMTTPGFIGREGLDKTKEGDEKTPLGVFKFNRAFGIAKDPGCQIPYLKVDEYTYWSADMRKGKKYNQLVDIREIKDLDQVASEHIIEYTRPYQYALNISYNEEGTPGVGSAIFLHCFGASNPYTGGCVAIPTNMMYFVMQHVTPDCVVIIDTAEKLIQPEPKS